MKAKGLVSPFSSKDEGQLVTLCSLASMVMHAEADEEEFLYTGTGKYQANRLGRINRQSV